MAAGAVAAGIGQAGLQFLGNWQQNRANRKLAKEQRDWQREENDRAWQRTQQMWQDTNAYNERMWGKQNEYNEQQLREAREYDLARWHEQNRYNSPIEQMARMKQAGLSPHLMYGKGTVGQAGQLSTSPVTTKAPNASAVNAPTPGGYTRAQAQNVMAGINAFREIATLKNINAQTDNTAAQTNVARQDVRIKALQFLYNKITLKDRKRLQKSLAEKAQQEVQLLNLDRQFKNDTYDERIQMHTAQLEQILSMRDIKAAEAAIKKWHKELAEKGLTPNDEFIYRQLSQVDWANVDLSNMDSILNILLAVFNNRTSGAGKVVKQVFGK